MTKQEKIIETMKKTMYEGDLLRQWHEQLIETLMDDYDEEHPVEVQLRLNECWRRIEINNEELNALNRKLMKMEA